MCNQHFTPFNNKAKHDEEHEVWSRRSFLQALGLAGSGSIFLGGQMLTASAPSKLTMALNASENDNILVLIRLNGGNDGLNTVVPLFEYDTYANYRPKIYLPSNNLFKLSDNFALPKYMDLLEPLWGEGGLKIVHGVGYEDQNLSHFAGSDNWAHTNPGDKLNTGYMGRYFENVFPDYLLNPPPDPAAIQIGNIGNLIFQGQETNYAFTVANPEELNRIAQEGVVHSLNGLSDCTYGQQLRFLRGSVNTTYTYSEVIYNAFQAANNSVNYPDGPLARQLAMVARLIKGGLKTKIFMVSIGGFDTHSEQLQRHQNLLTDLAGATDSFYKDLAASSLEKRVLSMTFSEFGRRVYENGSKGTDHGTAAPVMLFGPGMESSGFIGEHPSLNDLDEQGNLKPSTDFRDVYASVMAEWLCIDQALVTDALLNRPLNLLGMGMPCSTANNTNNGGDLTDNDDNDGDDDMTDDDNPIDNGPLEFGHFPSYGNNREVFINYTIPTATHVVVKLYNILGQDIGTLKNEMALEGVYKINVKEEVKNRLATGQYIYRITASNKNYSKSILIS